MSIEITLRFAGGSADSSLLDFYDAAIAFNGFQRSLALTSHLVINGEIITQAPALKGVKIYVSPPEPGSWKTVATIVGGVLLAGGTASRDSTLGHIFTSVYSYAINESLGFHVDFSQTLGEQLENSRLQGTPVPHEIDQGKIDSLIEKIEPAIRDIHRPISHSNTAIDAQIGLSVRGDIVRPLGNTFSSDTYAYMSSSRITDNPTRYIGKVSSYNYNTFKGRVYIEENGRSIPFTLGDNARTSAQIRKIVESLSEGAVDRFNRNAEFSFIAYRNESRTGMLKSLIILLIE